MTFDHLSDGQFEELSYDLLVALGFTNLSWRRGSGKGGASADQGRDIVAQLHRRDIDYTEQLETWFIQCKRYERGVPPEALQGAIAWAAAERPAVLLFVVSNFLSNPAKTWLQDYELNSRPPFRIKLWERKELERLVVSRAEFAAKYHLELGSSLQHVHPAHLQYFLQPSLNSLSYFFESLNVIEPSSRDDAFTFSFHSVINPRFEDPVTGDEKMADLMLDTVDYAVFRERCEELAEAGLAEHFIIQAIMGETLARTCRLGDPAQLASTLERHRQAILYFADQIRAGADEERIKTLRGAVSFTEGSMSSAPERQRQAAALYRMLCEQILPRLELEELLQRAKARTQRDA